MTETHHVCEPCTVHHVCHVCPEPHELAAAYRAGELAAELADRTAESYEPDPDALRGRFAESPELRDAYRRGMAGATPPPAPAPTTAADRAGEHPFYVVAPLGDYGPLKYAAAYGLADDINRRRGIGADGEGFADAIVVPGPWPFADRPAPQQPARFRLAPLFDRAGDRDRAELADRLAPAPEPEPEPYGPSTDPDAWTD